MKPATNFWPLGIVITLGIFFLGTVGLIVLACSQRNDLVQANYYEDEIGFQRQMDRVGRTQQLKTKARVVYDAAAQRINLNIPSSPARGPVQGCVRLYRPSTAELDRQLELKPDETGAQAIDAARLRPGLWRVKISWTAGGRDYFFEQEIIVGLRPS